MQWEDDDGEQNYILDEVTLGQAIQYHHSTDGRSITISVKISLEYDGPSHSGASLLVGKEADFAERYQGSFREISDPQQAISKVVVKISGPQ